ncbi:hypothetical protein D3C76_1482290 [compost metagenome]
MWEGPLLRTQAVEQGVADARQVQVASAGQLFEFIEQLPRVIEGKQAGLTRAQVFLQALGEIHGDGPVRACFAGWGNGPANVGNPPLGVGHRAFLFPPTGGWQQQVGEGRGFGGAKGFLQHYERARLQGRAHVLLVGQGLRRVGAGDP